MSKLCNRCLQYLELEMFERKYDRPNSDKTVNYIAEVCNKCFYGGNKLTKKFDVACTEEEHKGITAQAKKLRLSRGTFVRLLFKNYKNDLKKKEQG